jgi:hypothetical protein
MNTRQYIHHGTPTIKYIKSNWNHGKTLSDIAAELNLPFRSVKALAYREELKKRKCLF